MQESRAERPCPAYAVAGLCGVAATPLAPLYYGVLQWCGGGWHIATAWPAESRLRDLYGRKESENG